jgi:hypothetical protein
MTLTIGHNEWQLSVIKAWLASRMRDLHHEYYCAIQYYTTIYLMHRSVIFSCFDLNNAQFNLIIKLLLL